MKIIVSRNEILNESIKDTTTSCGLLLNKIANKKLQEAGFKYDKEIKKYMSSDDLSYVYEF